MNAPIANMDKYNKEMVKSLVDKIAFIDKVDADVFVDFGCADGTLLGFIKKLFPQYILIGFDNDPEMIERAKANPENDGITFTLDWDEVVNLVNDEKRRGHQACVVLSSVLHELHSYLSDAEMEGVWGKIWGVPGTVKLFHYVAIRDMMVSRTTSRASDPMQVARIRQLFDREMLNKWEAIWGSINENWSLTHFLLTYRYTHSWEREAKENYLPVNYEDFMASIPPAYFPIFMEHYTLPFLRRCVQKDFGFDLSDRTHLKLVLELRQ